MRISIIIKFLLLNFLIYSCNDNSTESTKIEETGTVKDIDGNIYKTIKIGNQWWMAENLKITHYRNGDIIPNITETTEWGTLSIGAYCNFINDSSYVEIYGRLYNWFAVNDARNMSPQGWHMPSDDDWNKLELFLGMDPKEINKTGARGYDEGNKIKETGNTHWSEFNKSATNSSGFKALPARQREYNGWWGSQDVGVWWTCTENDSADAWCRSVNSSYWQIFRNSYNKRGGFSIRCLKDRFI